MKPICKFSAIILATVAGLFMNPVTVSAEKGEKTLGLMGGYASYNNSGIGGLFFQYSFSRHVRISPELGYIFRNQEKSAFVCSVDMHFPFRVARGYKLYPLAGITYNRWDNKFEKHDIHGGIDLGGGMDLYFTSSLKLNLQAKYSLMEKTGGCYVQMGIGYIF